jgi:hypothetical protein
VIVARADFNPSVGNTDERFLEVFVLQTGCSQHCACSGSIRSFNQRAAAQLLAVFAHLRFPLALFAAFKSSPNSAQKHFGPSPRFWMMARISRKFDVTPPSPALVVAYDGLANSYNSGHDADLHAHESREFLHRHGAASHIVV